MERMSKTMAEGKEDLERAFNIMNEELLKAEYKARVGYYGKYMNEIMEEVAKETKSYKELEEENKKLNIKVASLEGEIKGLNYTIEKLKEENQYRESIADVLPEGEGHIAEETIQDLQARIKKLNEDVDYRHHRAMVAERGGEDED